MYHSLSRSQLFNFYLTLQITYFIRIVLVLLNATLPSLMLWQPRCYIFLPHMFEFDTPSREIKVDIALVGDI